MAVRVYDYDLTMVTVTLPMILMIVSNGMVVYGGAQYMMALMRKETPAGQRLGL